MILQEVHRVDAGGEGPDSEYAKECERFLRVAAKMADCTWSREEHEWLSRRNRSRLLATEAGRAELAAIDRAEATLLMDGRRRDKDGRDGAQQVNAERIRQLSATSGRPIASIRALHKHPEAVKRPDTWDAEEFRGLPAELELVEGARVMLTQNVWTEAGLMNGACGTVRGFMWPEGGDPGSRVQGKWSPLCVIVEFDEVGLGSDERGQARSFFPGEPGRERWVPVFPQNVGASGGGEVSREQFPLMLAWAVTHWKAQGMTLPYVRVRLGKAAATPGVGFVAVTRVPHVRRLVFDTDLPPYELFMAARQNASFRARRRYQLRAQARFSRTLRRHGFCEADRWTSEEAEAAAAMLQRVEVRRRLQEQRLRGSGRRVHADAWLWPGEEPNLEAVLAEEAKALCEGDLEAVAMHERVAGRLLGPLHEAAVREALGCLIPEELDPEWDGRRRPRGGGPLEERAGVFLQAGQWRVDVAQENALARRGPLRKDLLEFFLWVGRHVARALELPCVLGSVGLGERIGVARTGAALVKSVKNWQHWKPLEVSRATSLLSPVCVGESRGADGSRDWILVEVVSAREGSPLGCGAGLRVGVADIRRRVELAGRVGRHLGALVLGSEVALAEGMLCWEHVDVPACDDVGDSVLWCLGMVFGHLASSAGVEPSLDAELFLDHTRAALRSVFATFRRGCDAFGTRDVLKLLVSEQDCKDLLRALTSPPPNVEEAAAGGGPQVVTGARAGEEEETAVRGGRVLRALTWNISAATEQVSVEAPSSWTPADNLGKALGEVSRLCPDLVALQECPSEERLPGLDGTYALAGVAKSHCGFVHLYVGKELAMEPLSMKAGLPVVGCILQLGGVRVSVLAAHLAPGEYGEAKRAGQLGAALARCPGRSRLILGDLNVRQEEVEAWHERWGLHDAAYQGSSWDPVQTKYHDGCRARGGLKLDRLLYTGDVAAASCVVFRGRHYHEGAGFYLSDHFALAAFVHVWSGYSGTGEDLVTRSFDSRAALGKRRSDLALAETMLSLEREREGRERAHLERDRAVQRSTEAALEARRLAARQRRERADALRQEAFRRRRLV